MLLIKLNACKSNTHLSINVFICRENMYVIESLHIKYVLKHLVYVMYSDFKQYVHYELNSVQPVEFVQLEVHHFQLTQEFDFQPHLISNTIFCKFHPDDTFQ